jgi:hypothetical protein
VQILSQAYSFFIALKTGNFTALSVRWCKPKKPGEDQRE